MLHLPHIPMPHPPANLPVETFSAWLPDPNRTSPEHPRDGAIMHDRARILSIGDDPILLYSRRLVIEKDGYIVASLRSDAIVDEAQLRGFDLVILCHTIPSNAASRILEILWRQTPQTPVLLVSRLDRPTAADSHYIAVSANPVAILGVIAEQLAIHKS